MKKKNKWFNLFNSVYVPPVHYNTWHFTFPNYLTADFGYLYPVLCHLVYGGESFRYSLESFIRTQPLACPAFMSADVSFHYFFVPHRLTYEDWSDFIVRGDDGNTVYDKPYISLGDAVSEAWTPRGVDLLKHGSLFDFLNFPSFDDTVTDLTGKVSRSKIDMMPFNAYSLIYNEYYRDENLIPEVFIYNRSGSANNLSDYADYITELENDGYITAAAQYFANPMNIRRRAWRKDYFTSALPFLQKGPQISFASSSNTAVAWPYRSDNEDFPGSVNWFVGVRNMAVTPNKQGLPYAISSTGTPNDSDPDNYSTHQHPIVSGAYGVPLEFRVDGTSLQQTVMTISDMRVGLALQQWYELNARTGSARYKEYLLGHFGVLDRDARLQRPEYIGGFSHSIQISEVEQNSETSSSSPQGNLAGRGLGYARNVPLSYRFPEHGFVMAIMSIRPHAVYYQGMPRIYQYWDNFDYYDRFFDHLSEQSIKSSELFCDFSVEPFTDRDADFGYIPRHAEDRCMLGQMHGDFRRDMSYWIAPRYIGSSPQLDANFIEVQAYEQNLNASFAYEGTANAPSSHFICHLLHHITAVRPMSKYATPKTA